MQSHVNDSGVLSEANTQNSRSSGNMMLAGKYRILNKQFAGKLLRKIACWRSFGPKTAVAGRWHTTPTSLLTEQRALKGGGKFERHRSEKDNVRGFEWTTDFSHTSKISFAPLIG